MFAAWLREKSPQPSTPGSSWSLRPLSRDAPGEYRVLRYEQSSGAGTIDTDSAERNEKMALLLAVKVAPSASEDLSQEFGAPVLPESWRSRGDMPRVSLGC